MMCGEPTLPTGGATPPIAVSQLLFAAAMLVMWLLRACCLHVPFACRRPAAGRALRRARSPPRELILCVRARKSRAYLPPGICVEHSPRRRSLFFGDQRAWPAVDLYRSARPRKCRELLGRQPIRHALRNNMSAARLSNTENVASQIGNFFPKVGKYSRNLMQHCHTYQTLYSFT